MLCLKRKPNEVVTVTIPPGVYPKGLTFDILVRGFFGNNVSLGFAAPPEIKIWREELLNGTSTLNRTAPPHQSPND